ncbi:MAG: hypothetical protein WCJ75_16450, partial [Desulfomonile sp.]
MVESAKQTDKPSRVISRELRKIAFFISSHPFPRIIPQLSLLRMVVDYCAIEMESTQNTGVSYHSHH